MINAICSLANCFFGDNAPVSRCLRNSKIMKLNTAIQGITVTAASITSVVCFYLVVKDPGGSNNQMDIAIGGAGLILAGVSCCGCLYGMDHKKIINEGALRKTVHEAGRDIANEAQNVQQDIRTFTGNQSIIVDSIQDLEKAVKISSTKTEELESQLEIITLKCEEAISSEKRMKDDMEVLNQQIDKLSKLVKNLESSNLEFLEQKKEAEFRIEQIEKNIQEHEDEVLYNAQNFIQYLANKNKMEEIKKELNLFSDQHPDEYQEIIRSLPSLEF